ELLVRIELIWRLEILTLARWFLLLADDPGLHLLQLAHEIGEIHHEVAHHRKVVQGFDTNGTRQVVGQEGRARELRRAVHLHPTATTHAHPAQPPEGEGSVQVVLDVVEGIQDHPVLPKWDLVVLEGGFGFPFRPIARYGERDGGGHGSLASVDPLSRW